MSQQSQTSLSGTAACCLQASEKAIVTKTIHSPDIQINDNLAAHETLSGS